MMNFVYKRRFKGILIFAIAIILVCQTSMHGFANSGYTIKYVENEVKRRTTTGTSVNVLYLQDLTYRNNMGNISTTALNDIEYPFYNNWGISFNSTVGDIVGLTPVASCNTASVNTLCACGSPCDNSVSRTYHHTNIIKNLSKVKQMTNTSGYDIMVVLASSRFCGIWGTTHVEDVLGIAYIGEPWAYCTGSPSNKHVVNVRIIQHELSHVYGCEDHAANNVSPCIMSGSYDLEPLNVADVWCNLCEAKFDASLH